MLNGKEEALEKEAPRQRVEYNINEIVIETYRRL